MPIHHGPIHGALLESDCEGRCCDFTGVDWVSSCRAPEPLPGKTVFRPFFLSAGEPTYAHALRMPIHIGLCRRSLVSVPGKVNGMGAKSDHFSR